MRARLLKPGFFMNEELARLPVRARLLFAGLWCLADREGRVEDRPARIKAALFPYERLNIEPLIQALADAGFVKRYQVAYTRCLVLPSFATHQQPHHREPESKLPAEPRLSAASPQPSPTDPVTRSGKDPDLDQERTASRSVPFKVYAAIAGRVLKETEDLGLDDGSLAEELKREYAKAQIPYDAGLVAKAIEAAQHVRRRA